MIQDDADCRWMVLIYVKQHTSRQPLCSRALVTLLR